MRKGVFHGCLLGGLLLAASLFAERQQFTLKADHTKYLESTQQVIASSNVSLKYGDISIKADKLQFDTLSRVVWGSGKVTVTRGEESFDTTYFYFDLQKNIVKLDDIHIAVRPPDSQGDIYLKAQRLEDHGDIKIGRNGLFTTCDLEDPHYYVWAQKFKYIPEKRIIGYNAILYTPFLLVPFPVPFITLHYTPRYVYDISKRQYIWNFPTIGKKTAPGWGWFMQNTFDYNNIDGRDSSVFVDWFENKGIGLGVRHQYQFGNDYGSVYYYRLREADTGRLNEKKAWEQTFVISDPLNIKLRYEDVDAERINFSNRQKYTEREAQLNYLGLGNTIQGKILDKTDTNARLDSKSLNLSHSFNQEKRLSFAYNESDRTVSQLLRKNADLVYYKTLPFDMSIQNTFKYGFEDLYSPIDLNHRDERLEYYFLIEKRISPKLSFDINMSHLFDLDDKAYQLDSQSGRNDFLFKHPEFNLKYRTTLYGYDFSETFTTGRYQEVKYDSSTGLQRIFPENEESYVPNVYMFKQTLRKTYDGLPQKGVFETNLGYDQYLFDTAGKSIFEGDALYIFKSELKFTTQHFNFIQAESRYNSQYAPVENNSPFNTFDRVARNENIGYESLTFFYQSPTKYHWANRTGYNFILDQWRDYETDILIEPSQKFRFLIKSGKRMNFDKTQRSSRYHPLVSQFILAPSSNFSVNWSMSLDTNKLVDEHIYKVNQSAIRLAFKVGGNDLYQWNITTLLAYDTINQPETIDLSRYELQEIGIEKKDHCRTFSLSYRKYNDEIRFLFTINAYPKDNIGFSKTRNIWKVEGILDDSSEERF